ncbi:single-stranded DNA-binding protein [uncultured Peptoniphilus sp.]|uniref:single-stranded DNA-binding protein n=1 Tax=uncultured Peptoniphilus sp. TaxID=254354 RepID=UPI002805CD67|nr:single-stranded DNA-binding protein [uncultured Peptoniphilus sp.]
MNSCCLFGRLVRDPELRYTPQGTAIVRFTVACDRRLSKERKAEAEAAGQPTADFISCTAWRSQAELIANYFHKGDQIGIEGRIQTGSYEKDGRRVYTTEVVVNSLDFVSKTSGGSYGGNFNREDYGNTNYNQAASKPANNPPVNSAYNDDFPSSNGDSDGDGFFPMDNDDIPF